MPRRRRSYLPGHTFHITSRIIAREHWIVEDIRDQVVEIFEAPRNCDARIICHCVMPSHIHLVVRQGCDPLGQLMHNIKHRIARVIQRRHKRTGCIFERRFFDKPCDDPDYLRTVIAYTHLNPWTAGLCAHPDEYRWSSHGLYCNPNLNGIERVVPEWDVMCPAESESVEASSVAYRQLIAYTMAKHLLNQGKEIQMPPPPRFCLQSNRRIQLESLSNTRERDLRDIALAVLSDSDLNLPLDYFRFHRLSVKATKLRHEIIRRCTAAGHRPVDIAGFLRMSPNRVSEVAATASWRAPRFFTARHRRTRNVPEIIGSTGGPT